MSRPFKKQRANPKLRFGNLQDELRELVVSNGETWVEALGPHGAPLKAWVDGVIESLGGETRITPQKKALVIEAAVSFLLLRSVDRFVVQMPSIINKSRREVFSIVLQRKELAAAFGRQLADIGLERHDPIADQFVAELKKRYAAGQQGALPDPGKPDKAA